MSDMEISGGTQEDRRLVASMARHKFWSSALIHVAWASAIASCFWVACAHCGAV